MHYYFYYYISRTVIKCPTSVHKPHVLPSQNYYSCSHICTVTFLTFSPPPQPALPPALTHASCQLQSCGQAHAAYLHKSHRAGQSSQLSQPLRRQGDRERSKRSRGGEKFWVLQARGQRSRLRGSFLVVRSNFKMCVCSLAAVCAETLSSCYRYTPPSVIN